MNLLEDSKRNSTIYEEVKFNKAPLNESQFLDSGAENKKSIIDFDMLDDSVLYQTEKKLQRNVIKFKHTPAENLGDVSFQDRVKSLLGQVQENCKYEEYISQHTKKNANSKVQQPLDSLDDNSPFQRQQKVLESFLHCSQKYQGLIMPEKLRKLIKSAPNSPNITSMLKKREEKLLGIFSDLGDPIMHEALLEEALLKEFFLNDKKEQAEQLIDDLANNGLLRSNFKGHKKVQFYNKSVLQQYKSDQKKPQSQNEQRPIDKIMNKEKDLEYQNIKSRTQIASRMNKYERMDQHWIDVMKKISKNDVKSKLQNNLLAIDFLQSFHPKNLPDDIQEKVFHKFDRQDEKKSESNCKKYTQETFFTLTQEQQMDYINYVFRKCFFKYLNKKESEHTKIYKEMSKESFVQFLQSVNLFPDCIDQAWVDSAFFKIKKTKQIRGIIFSEFMHIMTNISFVYNKLEKESSEENEEFYSLRSLEQEQSLTLFFSCVFLEIEQQILDPIDKELRNLRYLNELVLKFQSLFSTIFSYALKQKQTENKQYLNFDDIFQLLIKLNVYPRLVTKRDLRYYYYYMINNDDGLDYPAFCTYINMIGLFIVRNGVNKDEKETQKLNKNSYNFNQLSGKRRLLKTEANLLNELRTFYTDSFYLDGSNVEQKLYKNLDDRKK